MPSETDRPKPLYETLTRDQYRDQDGGVNAKDIPPRPTVGLHRWKQMTDDEKKAYRHMVDDWDCKYGVPR